MPFRFGTRRSLGLPIVGGGAILKPQDVFATSLYTADGTRRRVVSGVDLLGRGGLVWEKTRNVASSHTLTDTVRGATKWLATDDTAAESTGYGASAFFNDGYTGSPFGNASTIAGYSIARAAKFFDIVTWTGDGTSNRQIPHGLGVVPGVIIVKRRDAASTSGWPVYHRSLTAAQYLFLNLTNAAATGGANTLFAAEPTSTAITLGSFSDVNASGGTYVAYLIAHDPSADGIVQCGSFTGNAAVTLGWSPQYILFKRTDAAGEGWEILDTARGWRSTGADPLLEANTSSAELTATEFGNPTPTGFQMANVTAGGIYIYLAIRAAY